ncbi:uncharacterized protein [Henckelia pumila]|uniref:uncharacterized protein n=1 Tax=Henckelia pumila TaxID=405737 RepID=UPI003C6E8916
MIDLSSCLTESAVQISEKTSCSRNSISSISCNSPISVPSAQNTVTCLYRAILSSTKEQILITVTWSKNSTSSQGSLNITIGTHEDQSISFKLNTNSCRVLFRKLKGSKSLEFNASRVEVFWDFSSARYRSVAEPEPVDGYYIFITFDSELGLFLGEHIYKARELTFLQNDEAAKFWLITRREHFSGNYSQLHYQTKARFCESGAAHDISIRRSGEMKNSVLSVCIDKKTVIRVKSLQWNFRGNETIFLDGLLVDLMWNVHDWLCNQDNSGHGVFMFRTRSRDINCSRLMWMEENKILLNKDHEEFSLIIFIAATCKN